MRWGFFFAVSPRFHYRLFVGIPPVTRNFGIVIKFWVYFIWVHNLAPRGGLLQCLHEENVV